MTFFEWNASVNSNPPFLKENVIHSSSSSSSSSSGGDRNRNRHCLAVTAFSTPIPPRHSISSSSFTSTIQSPLAAASNQHLPAAAAAAAPAAAAAAEITTPYHHPPFLQAYQEAMEEVLSFFRILQKNDKPSDLEAAKHYLFASQRLDLVTTTPSSSPSAPTDREEFQTYTMVQKEDFLKKSGMTTSQLQLVLRALSYLGDYCAKKQMSAPLYIAWDKLKESGLKPRENVLSTYLYIFSSFPTATDIDHPFKDVSGEVAFYHDMMYKPTENTVSIRIKSLVEEKRTQDAEKLLWDLEYSSEEVMGSSTGVQSKRKKQQKNSNGGGNGRLLRLRTCLPVLKSYCQQGYMSQALNLFHKMMDAPSVHLEAETYALVLSSLARGGYFRYDSEPIEDVADLGYGEEARGALLFDAIAMEMSKDVLEITSASAKDIRNAMVAGFASTNWVRNLQEVPYDCDLAPLNEAAAQDELVANRIRMGSNSTLCPRTNATLRLILLDDFQRQLMHDALLRMADSQFDAYETKLQTKGNRPSRLSLQENYAGKHLEGFAKWLNEREGEAFTAIIDGANVAYYGLGCINYHQLKLMVITLEKMGEHPLVIIPQKYTQKKFHLRQGYMQELPEEQLEIIQDLESSGKLYEVPHRCLDDYYWMLSSVSPQTKSRNGAILDVPADNDQGRFPGTRPILISNDQMRDHKLELLEPKLFRRWVSSHIVNYHFTPFFNDLKEDRDIIFSPADFTSREIQGNPCCGFSDDDGDEAMAWHFPVSDWDKNDRFCIKIPRT